MATQLQEAQRRYRTQLGMLAMTEVNTKYLMAKYNPLYRMLVFNFEFDRVKAAIEQEWKQAQAAYPKIDRVDSKRRSRARSKAKQQYLYTRAVEFNT